MPPIAVILVNYRNPDDTLACLESLRASGASGFAIILVNNFAADGSGAVLRGWSGASGLDFRYLEPGSNLGFTGGVNLGAEEAMRAGARHIMLLNNDTIVEPDFADKVAGAIAAHPGDVLAGCILEAATGEASWNIGRLSPWTGQVRHIYDRAYAGKVEFVSGCLMIIPAGVLRDVGLLDDRYFMYCEDFDFCLRLKDAGIAIRYCPSIVIRHKTSSSTTRSGTPKEYYRIRNQTHIAMNRAKPFQKACYLVFLALMMPYKLIRRPRLFPQALAGAWDGLTGRLGKKGG